MSQNHLNGKSELEVSKMSENTRLVNNPQGSVRIENMFAEWNICYEKNRMTLQVYGSDEVTLLLYAVMPHNLQGRWHLRLVPSLSVHYDLAEAALIGVRLRREMQEFVQENSSPLETPIKQDEQPEHSAVRSIEQVGSSPIRRAKKKAP